MSIVIYGIFFYLYVHFYFCYIRREKKQRQWRWSWRWRWLVGGVSMGTRYVIIYQLLWRWGRFIIVIIAFNILFYYWREFEPESAMTGNKKKIRRRWLYCQNNMEGTMIYSVYSKSPFFREKFPIDNLWRLPSQLDIHHRRRIDKYSYFYYFMRRKETFSYSKYFIAVPVLCHSSYNINNASEMI
jgi:hypothetical protein